MIGIGRSLSRAVVLRMLFVALAAANPAADVSQAADARRPNIVFVFSDDHAWQSISAYNEPRKLLQTPNIDRIAREGMRFDRCLVPNSICGPSRATILTGKYSHLNGFYNNSNSRFDGSQTTFPKLLRAAGYQTAIVGKWHLVSDPTGFDYWNILPGQGVYYNPTLIEGGRRIEHPGYATDVITDVSLDWLKGRDKTKPFLLMCQHKAPHREWEPALRHLGHDRDRVYPEPDTLFDDYAGRGLAERDQDMTIEKTMTARDNKLVPPPQLSSEQRAAWDAYYEPRNAKFRQSKPTGRDLVRWKYQRYMHDYLGTIKAVDESVGRLLRFLDDEGLADNTIVVYASDQGFFLGEHGWFDKRWIFEESMRTPLLVRWPGVTKPGSVNNDLVSNVDFAETFLDAAGVAVPAEMQGRSLVGVLGGRTPADWRKAFYYHYYEFPTPHHVRPHYGVVTDRYKLVRFYGPDTDYWELFDRRKDPLELKSVFGQAEYVETQRGLERELARLRTELKVPEQDAPEASGRRAAVERRPNILWITSEDHGPHLGCYGDRFASTPNVDALAARGMIYARAWSNAPVCAPARTTLISGLYPPSTGSEHMRSMVAYPAGKQMFPQLLRAAGYYCTNNAKEDYNLAAPGPVWDVSSREAHWKNHPQGRPFFAVFNSEKSHESRMRARPHTPIHDPALVRVPAYHPDTPEVRRDWAQYYDVVSAADADAGARLKELDDAGLADETIVFYFADHGSGMPRNKRWPYDSGLHVPLVVYIPQKFAALRPADYAVGGRSDRLVSFVDFAPTVLSLAGIKPPEWMQGHAFLGPHAEPPQPFVYGFRGRMDERYDMVRSVTDGRFVYVRNYMPHKVYGQYLTYMFQTPTTQVWRRMHDLGQLNAEQDAFWNPKPPEELYDLAADRDEVHNLAGAAEFEETLTKLRGAQRDLARRIRDVGFLPEGEIHARSQDTTPHDMGHDEARYPFERVLAAAELASGLKADAVSTLTAGLGDADSAVRYWAALGLLMRGQDAVTSGRVPLVAALGDTSPYVRIVAAEALGRFGGDEDLARSLQVLETSGPSDNVFVVMSALNALDALGERGAGLQTKLRQAARSVVVPHARYAEYVPRLLEAHR